MLDEAHHPHVASTTFYANKPYLFFFPRLFDRRLCSSKDCFTGQSQFGLGPSYWMDGCAPVIWLLHLKHTHSACHSRVVWFMFGAQSMWRLGSSLHDVSSSGWVGSIRTRRGQHSGMSGGGFGGLSLGLTSSSGISGTGHSTSAARRVCSR